MKKKSIIRKQDYTVAIRTILDLPLFLMFVVAFRVGEASTLKHIDIIKKRNENKNYSGSSLITCFFDDDLEAGVTRLLGRV